MGGGTSLGGFGAMMGAGSRAPVAVIAMPARVGAVPTRVTRLEDVPEAGRVRCGLDGDEEEELGGVDAVATIGDGTGAARGRLNDGEPGVGDVAAAAAADDGAVAGEAIRRGCGDDTTGGVDISVGFEVEDADAGGGCGCWCCCCWCCCEPDGEATRAGAVAVGSGGASTLPPLGLDCCCCCCSVPRSSTRPVVPLPRARVSPSSSSSSASSSSSDSLSDLMGDGVF